MNTQKLGLLSLCIFFALSTFCFTWSKTAQSAIHVEGNKLVNASGTEMVFQGICALDPIIQCYEPNENDLHWGEDYYETMAEWGANIIRIPIHPKSWRNHSKQECIDVINQAIAWAKQYQMYVFIDFHSIGFPPSEEYDTSYEGLYQTNQQEWREFWKTIAQTYKNNPVVAGYEIFNEPTFKDFLVYKHKRPSVEDWKAWRDNVESVVDDIQRVDKQKPIIVGGLSWAYDLSYALNYPVRRSNIVYSTHPYPDSEANRSWEEAFGKLKSRYPVFATEFGFEPSGQKGLDKYKGKSCYKDAIVCFLNDRKISWTAWCFSSAWTPTLLQDSDFTPTVAGEFFRDVMLCGK